MASVTAGALAPPVVLPTTQGERSLDQMLADGRLVLAFYVEDGTPACQRELTLLGDAYDMIREFGGDVLAVSADSLESHRAYLQRGGVLPFALASDPTCDVARAYGVAVAPETRRNGRALFVIDRDRRVLLALPHFQPESLSQVEAIFAALGTET